MTTAVRFVSRGVVQGVGYRPFVYRIAREESLAGWVRNSARGAEIFVEGERSAVARFRRRLDAELPRGARHDELILEQRLVEGRTLFEILASSDVDERDAVVTPDMAVCPDCVDELRTPGDRRYRYPFISCTACGPRYSILESLPYDRPQTSMRAFPLCPPCQREYDDPLDRRFHAQTNACPVCGPKVWLEEDQAGAVEGDEALARAARLVQGGAIVAVKGIGGFHLLVDAMNDRAVARLRRRKLRDEKPLAIMVRDLDEADRLVSMDDVERGVLTSVASPILLARRRDAGGDGPLAAGVAPGAPDLGLMLPYTPLHRLLLDDLDGPVVATSGNLSDEPICHENDDARARLAAVADAFLLHDRPIVRPVDDAVAQVVAGRSRLIRLGRGYAPGSFAMPGRDGDLLATGADIKSSVAIRRRGSVFVSQHIGDLDHPRTRRQHARAARAFASLYDFSPSRAVCDRHPDYVSSIHAENAAPRIARVQHHEAHVWSVLAERGEVPLASGERVLGVAWDGTGYGDDGTVWGGEFFQVERGSMRRVATFRPFPLPGGDRAAIEPRRAALGLLHALRGALAFDLGQPRRLFERFTDEELRIMRRMLDTRTNAPLTTSVGRLFDAVAALAGVRAVRGFEGQAAMELEASATRWTKSESRLEEAPRARRLFEVDDSRSPWLVDVAPFVERVVELAGGLDHDPAPLAAALHGLLVEIVREIARRTGVSRVALSGGCFQNRLLLERTIEALRIDGREPLWNERVPANDGGIPLGQIAALVASESSSSGLDESRLSERPARRSETSRFGGKG